MRHVPAAVFAVLLSMCLLAANAARSQPPSPTVPARVAACVPIDRKEFQRLLAMELGAAQHSANSVQSDDRSEITLTCVDSEIELTLSDAPRNTSMTRRVDLRHVARSARTRLMALAVAELVIAHRNDVRSASVAPEPELVPEPAPEPVPQPAPAPAPEQAQSPQGAKAEQPSPAEQPPQPEPPRAADRATPAPPPSAEPASPRDHEPSLPAQLAVAAEVLAFSRSFELIPSLALSLTVPLAAAFALEVGAQLGTATLDGVLRTGSEHGAVSIRTTVGSLLFAVLYVEPLDVIELAGGIGFRTGLAFLRGEPVDGAAAVPESSSAPWTAPLVTLGLRYRATRHLRVIATIEGGYLVFWVRARGPEGNVMELRGVWSAATLGLGWAF